MGLSQSRGNMFKLVLNAGRKVAEVWPTVAACANALCKSEHVHKGPCGWAGKMGRCSLHWLWDRLNLELLQGHGNSPVLPVPEQQCIPTGCKTGNPGKQRPGCWCVEGRKGQVCALVLVVHTELFLAHIFHAHLLATSCFWSIYAFPSPPRPWHLGSLS